MNEIIVKTLLAVRLFILILLLKDTLNHASLVNINYSSLKINAWMASVYRY
jgi:hypothetical protein